MAGTKLHIVSCFALFALLVAPLAWRQTQVQRVELPDDRIRALAWNSSRLAAPARPVVRVLFRQDATDTSVAALAKAVPRVAFVAAQLPSDGKHEWAQLPAQQLDDALLQRLPATRDAAFSLVLLCSAETSRAATLTVGKHRHAWSAACSASDAALTHAVAELTQRHLFPQENALVGASSVAPGASNRAARVAVQYRLQFTLLQEGGDAQWGWDFDKLEKRYFTPVLEKLSSIAQFTIEHQTVHYARLAKEIHTDATSGVHYINADDLKHFKSTNDFLTSSVLADREQVLYFMAALPSQDHAPLVIKSDQREATAFEIPSWGVVVVLDPRELARSPDAEAKELRRVVGRFVSQLRTLLGLPSFVKRQRAAEDAHTGIVFLPSPQYGVAQWELDVVVGTLLRRHVRSSIETLQSIVQLVTDMPELSVLERVAQRITHAVDLVERVLEATSVARDAVTLDETALLAVAREAVEEADAAYYDHTMIRQLYFPQEQLLGVFAPLLAPLLLPFFVGWLREMKQLRAKRQKKASEASKKDQ